MGEWQEGKAIHMDIKFIEFNTLISLTYADLLQELSAVFWGFPFKAENDLSESPNDNF